MAWEENSCICLNMQLIAILSRIGVYFQQNMEPGIVLPDASFPQFPVVLPSLLSGRQTMVWFIS